ncbi:MAG: metal-dependent hydrolase [Leptolyngbyaceae cyanobacterium MO_188.B28]|nr:metal-dependent hydrolase [Leptolyngbyaceae cyanobacterium MO_188.B28]
MPSPIGHTLAGFCGYVLMHQPVKRHQRRWLLLSVILTANLADFDMLPGLMMGDPGAFHRQWTHSLTAAIAAGIVFSQLARYLKLPKGRWGIWAAGLYAGHVLLDMLVTDVRPPAGVQLLWPFSMAYYISPITVFASFNYFDPTLGFVKTLLRAQNLFAILRESLLIAPLIGVSAYLRGRARDRVSSKKNHHL